VQCSESSKLPIDEACLGILQLQTVPKSIQAPFFSTHRMYI
jgi:hypothetical protein